MSRAAELVAEVEAHGGRLTVEDEYLVIDPSRAGLPLASELRQYKQEIIGLLRQRKTTPAPEGLELPAGVLLISWAPKAAPIRLSECEVVVNVETFITSTLAQLSAELRGSHWLAGNWGLRGLLNRLAAVGVVVVVDDRRALQ